MSQPVVSREDPGPIEWDLVQAAQAGNQTAFSQLVARHQRFVCSFVYALTGSLSSSEDIAQETFVVAWKRLRGLRSPDRFRGWLYAIARNLIHRSRRRRSHPLPSMQVPLAAEKEIPSIEPSPLDRVISQEEEQVIWRALDAIPEIYRLPLVLFYSEDQSVANVASALGLTETAAKVRLTRGRRMLHDQVTAMLESALRRVRPGKPFTAAVMIAVAAAGAPEAHAGPAARRLAVVAVPAVLIAALGLGLVLRSRGRQPEGDSFRAQPTTAAARALVKPRRSPAPWFVAESSSPEEEPSPAAEAVVPPVLSFDFEDGILPPLFTRGHVVPGPPGSPSRFCATGTILLNPRYPFAPMVSVGHDDATMFRYAGEGIVSFDYWIPDDFYGDPAVDTGRVSPTDPPSGRSIRFPINVELRDLDLDQNLHHFVYNYATETWRHAEVPLARFTSYPSRPPPAEGDRIGSVNFHGGRPAGKPFFIDNIKVQIR